MGRRKKDVSNKTKKEKGKRLKQLRIDNGFKQDYVARKTNQTKANVSLDENGVNDIDEAKAEIYADFYNVRSDYILCKTDIPNKSISFYHSKGENETDESDVLFIKFLESMGFEIKFLYCSFYHPKHKEGKIISFDDYENNNLELSEGRIDDFEGFSLSKAKCKLKEKDSPNEILILRVAVNYKDVYSNELSYMDFLFYMYQLNDLIFTTSFLFSPLDDKFLDSLDKDTKEYYHIAVGTVCSDIADSYESNPKYTYDEYLDKLEKEGIIKRVKKTKKQAEKESDSESVMFAELFNSIEGRGK